MSKRLVFTPRGASPVEVDRASVFRLIGFDDREVVSMVRMLEREEITHIATPGGNVQFCEPGKEQP